MLLHDKHEMIPTVILGIVFLQTGATSNCENNRDTVKRFFVDLRGEISTFVLSKKQDYFSSHEGGIEG